jgi:hypothetical protein
VHVAGFFLPNNCNQRRSHLPTHTHPYERTHAHSISMSTSERLSWRTDSASLHIDEVTTAALLLTGTSPSPMKNIPPLWDTKVLNLKFELWWPRERDRSPNHLNTSPLASQCSASRASHTLPYNLGRPIYFWVSFSLRVYVFYVWFFVQSSRFLVFLFLDKIFELLQI